MIYIKNGALERLKKWEDDSIYVLTDILIAR